MSNLQTIQINDYIIKLDNLDRWLINAFESDHTSYENQKTGEIISAAEYYVRFVSTPERTQMLSFGLNRDDFKGI